ncbi:transcriptional regulator, TetR family [Granulicella rosea]|uniref:Transcriptional regulator, TetR family n=1 Tax=Granulicella rosea TaxID=474952 RepID=A0A239MN32_9BACT|nr:TetR/AcrR family transcriptional regulator [Granulicella rosea]SNT43663.1 transcriptional regulator, TetR family [Granulicella rosea]
MKSTSADGPNKHQLKTAATLRSLLDAAERVFVRDGYERAQMETIAAEAQRTKGAVYAHFRSKEDIFFALLERKGKARRDAFLGSAEGMDLKQRRAIVKKMFLATLADESWPILMLEFKLFALRNKASLQRIRDLYQLVYDDMGKVLLSERPATARSRESEMLALAVLRGMPSAIILEKQFHPAFQSPDSTRQVFDAIFDALLEIGSDPSTPAST